jgi:hypothetical protein
LGPSSLATPVSHALLLLLPLQELFENVYFCQEQKPVRAVQWAGSVTAIDS